MTDEATILVVDDKGDGRRILAALLGQQGYDVYEAGNGPQALTLAEEIVPDLILLDVMMPGMDGFEVCRRLRANPTLAEVPVVLVTALDDRQSRLQGIEAGADDFIVKPFDPVELTARVRSITRLNRYRRLLAERAKFNWVVEHAEDGYLEIDADDRILYANPRAVEYLGLAADEEATAHRFLALARQQYNCEPLEAWDNWPENGTQEMTRYLVRPDSQQTTSLWLQVEANRTTAAAAKSYVIRLRDVTGEVRAQRNQWTFHAQVSHKLRTPLTLLSGFFEMLESDLDLERLSATQKSILESALRSAHRLRDEIMSVFRFMEAPAILRPGQSHCTLADIAEIAEQTSAALELHAYRVIFEGLDATDAVEVAISQRAMELIIWELLDNARKFHPAQSPAVEIRLAADETPADEAPAVHLQISDNGRTLSPDQLKRIWQPYYQAERYFTGQVQGMGLGLSMVAMLVWEVGGAYRISNREDGPGIIVELHLPLAP